MQVGGIGKAERLGNKEDLFWISFLIRPGGFKQHSST